MLLLLLFYALVLLCVVEMRRREPPFIGGEEEGIWKILHPYIEGTKPTYKYIEPGRHHHTDVGQDGEHQPTKFWAKRGR